MNGVIAGSGTTKKNCWEVVAEAVCTGKGWEELRTQYSGIRE
ncbi:MAG: hypothetical protein PHV18_13975 [Lachnospiraceae bacterium]|nr:hypothetical protein [Lachnospiraceae bacterium]